MVGALCAFPSVCCCVCSLEQRGSPYRTHGVVVLVVAAGSGLDELLQQEVTWRRCCVAKQTLLGVQHFGASQVLTLVAWRATALCFCSNPNLQHRVRTHRADQSRLVLRGFVSLQAAQGGVLHSFALVTLNPGCPSLGQLLFASPHVGRGVPVCHSFALTRLLQFSSLLSLFVRLVFDLYATKIHSGEVPLTFICTQTRFVPRRAQRRAPFNPPIPMEGWHCAAGSPPGSIPRGEPEVDELRTTPNPPQPRAGFFALLLLPPTSALPSNGGRVGFVCFYYYFPHHHPLFFPLCVLIFVFNNNKYYIYINIYINLYIRNNKERSRRQPPPPQPGAVGHTEPGSASQPPVPLCANTPPPNFPFLVPEILYKCQRGGDALVWFHSDAVLRWFQRYPV